MRERTMTAAASATFYAFIQPHFRKDMKARIGIEIKRLAPFAGFAVQFPDFRIDHVLGAFDCFFHSSPVTAAKQHDDHDEISTRTSLESQR